MASKRKHDNQNHYTPSTLDSNHGHHSKRSRNKIRSQFVGDHLSSFRQSTDHDSDFIVSGEASDEELASTPKHQVRRPDRHVSNSLSLEKPRHSPIKSWFISNNNSKDLNVGLKAPNRIHQVANSYFRATKKQNWWHAELANLADFNRPPETQPCTRRTRKPDYKDHPKNLVADEYIRQPYMSTRKVTTLNGQSHVQDAHVTKSKVKAPSPNKRRVGNRLLAEVQRLQLWNGWESDEEDYSSDTDTENELPRSYARHYPPTVSGTQNAPWSDLPGEVRNKIYEYALSNEEQKAFNLTHYPMAFPVAQFAG